MPWVSMKAMISANPWPVFILENMNGCLPSIAAVALESLASWSRRHYPPPNF